MENPKAQLFESMAPDDGAPSGFTTKTSTDHWILSSRQNFNKVDRWTTDYVYEYQINRGSGREESQLYDYQSWTVILDEMHFPWTPGSGANDWSTAARNRPIQRFWFAYFQELSSRPTPTISERQWLSLATSLKYHIEINSRHPKLIFWRSVIKCSPCFTPTTYGHRTIYRRAMCWNFKCW